MNLAVDTNLADTTGDELRVLGAEVENQDTVSVDIGSTHPLIVHQETL
jgi:hypothetical protein